MQAFASIFSVVVNYLMFDRDSLLYGKSNGANFPASGEVPDKTRGSLRISISKQTKISGKILEIRRKIPGKFAGKSWKISGKNRGKFPGKS